MRTKLFTHSFIVLVFVWAVSAPLPSAFAQGTAFTYQGQLTVGTNPATGLFDLTFTLYGVSSGGSILAGPVTNAAVPVTNGLFTTQVDFGAGVFTGSSNWLSLGVSTNGAAVGFTTLSPRQQLTPTPYAIFAEGAAASGLTGTIPAGDLSGTYGGAVTFSNAGNSFSGNGAGLTNVNASLLGGLAASNFWQTAGNAGTTAGVNFVGTTDNQPLDLDAYGARGLELAYASRGQAFPFLYFQYSMNVNAGYWGNAISNNVIGATIAGGGDEAGALYPLAQYGNTVSADFGAVGGGYANKAGYAAAVPGGFNNTATGTASFAAGADATTTNNYSFVWSDGTALSSSGNNCFDIHASGGVHINGTDLYLVANNNRTYGLGYRSTFAGSTINGPVLYSYLGGALGAVLPDEIALQWDSAGNVAMPHKVGIDTTTTPTETLEINGTSRLDDNTMYLRAGTDRNHGLGYQNTVDGIFFDGPFLFGYNGGALGVSNPNTVTLQWYYDGTVWISNNCSVASLTIRGGADLAEPFNISSQNGEVPQGAVVVIDEQNPGHLKLSDQPYDTHVAGVVSGANGIKPGIQMHQQGLLEGGRNVALTGRVYVQADASNGPIKPGDLLTTSSMPGHAMKVTDHARAAGAILGKAMTGLSEGKGMVLVLVTLQ